jgi:acyl-CoA thioester hydrolase
MVRSSGSAGDLHPHVPGEHASGPGVVVAAEEGDRHPRLHQVGERGEHPEVLPGDHGAVLEPEVEEVAVDEEPRGVPADPAEEVAEGALGALRDGAEVDVGDDEVGSLCHGAKVPGPRAATTGALPVAAPPGYLPPRPERSARARLARMSDSPHGTVELRVRYPEVDRMGFVYHAHYLTWCELGRTELIRDRLGLSYADLEDRGVLLAVSDASLRYHRAARYDERVRVETRVEEVRSRTLTFGYTIVRIDGRGAAGHGAHRAHLHRREGRPRRIPPEVAGALAKGGEG